jgi:hypothetical protein
VGCQALPEVIDLVDLARLHDVIVDSADSRIGMFIFDQVLGRHVYLPYMVRQPR